MPAPAHLHGILAVLGDGGTVDLAERVHRHILDLPGADADTDALRAENAALEAKVEEARALVGESFYDAVGKLQLTLTEVGIEVTPDDDIVDVACLVIREQARVISEGNAEIHAQIEKATTEGIWEGADATPVPADSFPSIGQLWHTLLISTREDRDKHLARALKYCIRDFNRAGLDEFAADITHNPAPDAERDPDDDLDWHALEAAPVEMPAPDPTNDEIRTWCLANEVPCSARGPVPRRSRDAYLAKHQSAPAETEA